MPFGRSAVSFFTVLNGIFDSSVSILAPARVISIVVDSSTGVRRSGFTVSPDSSVMSPASSTDFTSVKLVPSTVRVLPLIETLTYVASPSSASRALPREAAWESETEYAVGCGAASGFASA